MLVHRDYRAEEHGRIDFEPGRHLRFINPGGLMPKVLSSVRVDQGGRFEPVRSATELRNSTIADIFWGLGPMDKAGSGLADVQEMMLEHGGRSEFAISEDNESVQATLFQPRQAAPDKSRVARRVSPTELYITNLLPFRVVPQTVSVVPLRDKPLADAPLFDSDESPRELPIFLMHGGKLLSFADLRLFPDFVDRRGYLDRAESKPVEEYLREEDSRRLFVWLVGKHWDFFLHGWKEQGLFVDHYKKKRAFFQLVKGEKNTVVYDSRARKGVKRDVVKQRTHGKYTEYENEGLYYAAVEFAGFWAMQLKTLRVTNPKLTYKEQLLLERLQKDEEAEQLSLFESSEDEKKLAAELLPQAEELLFRNFHRALKAACMMEQNAIPIQVIRRQAYVSAEAKQSDATRAWNLGLALYYKAGNIPWRPAGLTKDTCYVGVSFHHLKRRSGDLVYASLAEAFSNDVEPFTLKGASIPRSQSRNKQPYLSEPQSADLIGRVVEGYKVRVGSSPSRVVVHKTSRYQPEEEDGFRKGVLSEVAACDLVWLSPTRFRVLRRGMREPVRGTLCTVEDRDHYLFTTGYVPWWSQYPGPHIPAPLEIGAGDGTDIAERAREILALTKMNWNSAEGIGRHPITVSFARRVGMIMTEMEEEVVPNPLYRFYM